MLPGPGDNTAYPEPALPRPVIKQQSAPTNFLRMQSIADLSAEMAWGNNQAGIVGLNVVPVASMQPMHGQLSMHVPLTTGSALGPFSAHMSGHVAVHRPVSYLPVVPGNSGQLGPDLLPHDVALHDTALSLSGGFAQQAPAITASSLSGGYVLPPQPPQALFDLTNQPAWVDAAAPPTANSSDHAIAALLRAVTGLDLDSLPSANNVASSTVCSPIGTDNTVYGSQLSGVSGIDSDAAIGSWDMSSKAYSRPNSALSFGPVPSLQHHNLLSAASNRLVQARSGSLHNMAYGRSAKQQVQALHNAVAANGNLLPGSSRMASRPTSGNKVHGMHTSTAVSAGVSGLFDGNAVNQAMEAARQLLQASSTHRHTSSAPGSGNVVGAAPAAAATVPGGVTPLPAALVGTGLVPSAGSLTGDASTDCAVGGDGAVEEGRVDGPPGELASQQSYSRHKLYKTELCKNWAASGTCCYGVKCQFAHGEGELRVRASKKKQAALAAAAAAAAVDGRGVEEEGGGLAAAAPCPSYDQVSDAAPMPLDPTAA